MGFLGRLSELPSHAPPSVLLDSMHSSSSTANNVGNPFTSWNSMNQGGQSSTPIPDHILPAGYYLHPPHSNNPMGIDSSTRNHEDVEVMSTDSSSSSSSDSQ